MTKKVKLKTKLDCCGNLRRVSEDVINFVVVVPQSILGIGHPKNNANFIIFAEEYLSNIYYSAAITNFFKRICIWLIYHALINNAKCSKYDLISIC